MAVSNDETFLKLYTGLSSIIITNATKVFGRSKSYVKSHEAVTNATIKSIVSDICCVRGAIQFEKSGCMVHVSLKAMKHHHTRHTLSFD